MKSLKIQTPKLKTALLRQERIARYVRGRLLAHPDLVLKALQHKAAAPADFRTNPLLFGE